MNIDVLGQLFSRKEPLNPELLDFLVDSPIEGAMMLHHPLLIEVIVTPERFAFINEQFRHKKEIANDSLKDGDYKQYIFIHERPYRLQAFMECLQKNSILNGEYWPILSSVWIDSENIYQNNRSWRKCWNAKIPHKNTVMSEDEYSELTAMPEEIRVYRGVGRASHRYGLSWTTDFNTAKWFAKRYNAKKPRVIFAKVAKENVHAFLTGRNESEIVTNKYEIVEETIIK